MASPHKYSTLPNHPNYYWNQALISFDSNKIWECDMYLILFYQSIIGD
jgi:hypothetical protein